MWYMLSTLGLLELPLLARTSAHTTTAQHPEAITAARRIHGGFACAMDALAALSKIGPHEP